MKIESGRTESGVLYPVPGIQSLASVFRLPIGAFMIGSPISVIFGIRYQHNDKNSSRGGKEVGTWRMI